MIKSVCRTLRQQTDSLACWTFEQGQARKSKEAAQARRLLALATVDDGATRTEAARVGGVTLQIVRCRSAVMSGQVPCGQSTRQHRGR
jgi:hypothetical protein